jgi:hypothetical protein
MKNAERDVDERDDDEIDLDGSARVMDVNVSIPDVKIYLADDEGDDVVISTRLFDGTNIYLNLLTDEDDLSIALADKWDFAHHYRLLQTNLVKTASTINFDLSGTWVYAIDDSAEYDAIADSVKLVYVGRGDADLPIYQDYFFALKELELASEVEEPTTEAPVENEGEGEVNAGNPAGGPVESAPNVNYNPGTGR